MVSDGMQLLIRVCEFDMTTVVSCAHTSELDFTRSLMVKVTMKP